MFIPTTQLAQGGSGAGLLAVSSYAPGSDSTIADITSASLVDVDAVNVSVTFTAPASGNVVVVISALMGTDVTGSRACRFGLREAGSTVGGPLMADGGGTTAGQRYDVSIYVTGVAAGAHTYKFAASVNTGHVLFYGGPTYGPILMRVMAAP